MWEGAELSIKGGIARAYKTPNLYQSNPNYLLYSRGNGCNASEANMGGCYLVGNRDLKPEISVNKEIGLVLDKGTSSSLSGSLVVESSPPSTPPWPISPGSASDLANCKSELWLLVTIAEPCTGLCAQAVDIPNDNYTSTFINNTTR